MIRELIQDDREKIKNILIDTNNFSDDEVSIALELLDVALNNEDQKDYEIFVDVNDENTK
jgi:hypothetical protein